MCATKYSPSLYYCKNTAPTAISKVSGFTTNGFVNYGSFKAGEVYNASLNRSRHYLYYYSHYHYLLVLSKSVKGAAMVAKFTINLL